MLSSFLLQDVMFVPTNLEILSLRSLNISIDGIRAKEEMIQRIGVILMISRRMKSSVSHDHIFSKLMLNM